MGLFILSPGRHLLHMVQGSPGVPERDRAQLKRGRKDLMHLRTGALGVAASSPAHGDVSRGLQGAAGKLIRPL